MRKKIVVVGSSFAGLTAAVELRKKLGTDHEIKVISKDDKFVFMPSLIWLPFGLREESDVTFPVAPILENKGIGLGIAQVTRIDLDNRMITHSAGTDSYDYLVIATGPVNNFAAVPGLGPYEGFTQSIFGLQNALMTRDALEPFWDSPGPVVVGAVQGASCFGAAYEFLLNFDHQLKKRGLRDRVSLTYLTPEPYLGHFGIGGFGNGRAMVEGFFKHEGIEAVVNTSVREIKPGSIELSSGQTLPFSFAMLAPSFLGVTAVRNCSSIVNAAGFVETDSCYRTLKYPNVYAAGVAVAMAPPEVTAVPCGVPKTGYLSEEMAKIVAHNIAASIHGEPLIERAPAEIDAKCVLDAGNNGIIMTSDRFLEPREHAWLIPGPEAHWAKLAFEKYFLFTRSHGWV